MEKLTAAWAFVLGQYQTRPKWQVAAASLLAGGVLGRLGAPWLF